LIIVPSRSLLLFSVYSFESPLLMAAQHKPKPLPFVASFAAGAIAGVSEILTFYPLDVVCWPVLPSI
jgi:hypothetical protein